MPFSCLTIMRYYCHQGWADIKCGPAVSVVIQAVRCRLVERLMQGLELQHQVEGDDTSPPQLCFTPTPPSGTAVFSQEKVGADRITPHVVTLCGIS